MMRHVALSVLGGVLLAGGACSRPADTPQQTPSRGAGVVLDTPHNAARTLLRLLDQHLDAVAAGDVATARAALDQVVWHVAARDHLITDYRTAIERDLTTPADVVADCAANWAAAVAYYIDGVQTGVPRLAINPAGENVVSIDADVNGETAVIKIYCVAKAGEYRVHRVDFDRPTPAVTTRPAP